MAVSCRIWGLGVEDDGFRFPLKGSLRVTIRANVGT